MLSANKGGFKYHFLSLWYDLNGIEPWFHWPLANTVLIRTIIARVKIRVMVNVMDCELVVYSRYFVHFWTNNIGNGTKPLIAPLPAIG